MASNYPSLRRCARTLKALSILFPLFLAPLAANAFEPVFQPALETARAAGPIQIDGRLGDPGWDSAGRTSRFVERSPGENIEPLVETEAYLTYDDDYLYVAFVCHDDPSSIRASLCQRDQYDDNDMVGVMLDTYGEGQWAYEFFVNPYGIQKDLMWTNVQGEDEGFDLVWYSAADIHDGGYTVELAIPFAGMRFPSGQEQIWRVDFGRNHPRESYRQYSWAPRDRNEQCLPCQWGTVSGIRGIKPGRGIELLPSFIAYQTGGRSDALDADSAFDNRDLMGEPSLGAKYSLSSAVTLEATLNPDFSQIESDAGQIDVNSTIVQRYPERRPFFQEGNDLFRTMFNSFYTRMVNDPEIAAKGTARWERTSLAYLLARDEHSPYIIPTEERNYSAAPGKSTVQVLRGLQSLGNNSQVGFMATDRRYDDGGHGTILSGDANIRLTSTTSWLGQLVYNQSREPEGFEISPGETFDDSKHTVDLDGESFSGTALITELRRNSRTWSYILDYNHLTPTYRTQTGYDPWNDQRNAFIYTQYNFYPGEGLIERIQPNTFVNGRWNMDGKRKWVRANVNLNGNLRWAQTNFGVGFSRRREQWSGVEFDKLWTLSANLGSRPLDWLGFGSYANYGVSPALITLERGDQLGLGFNLDMKPLDRLIIEPGIDYIESKQDVGDALLFRQTIARMRVRWQVNQRLSLRMVLQNNDSNSPPLKDAAVAGSFPSYHLNLGSKWEADLLATYRINPFSVFYLGSTRDYHDYNAAFEEMDSRYRLTERQYFMKIQYLFQI